METVVQKLRTHGIAVTPQRVTILAILQSRRDHPSAEEIFNEVRRQLPAISFNTVYKTLEVFSQKGLVIKVNPLHDVARYDGETGPHTHLICRRCHRIVDLPWTLGDPVALTGKNLHGFQVEHQALTLWGLCPRCQPQEKLKEN